MTAQRNCVPAHLCELSDLTEGHAKGFDPWGEGQDSVLALLHYGEVRIYRNSCPHLGVRLEYRKDSFMSADAQRIVCYAHGAHFLPDSGLCIYGPCLGDSLIVLRYRLDSSGSVFLEDSWLSVDQKNPD